MEKKKPMGKKLSNNPHELKLSELEEVVRAFRDAYGEKKLMEYLRSIVRNAENKVEKTAKKAGKKLEPTISELEDIFKIFEGDHGHQKLLDSIAQAVGKTASPPKAPLIKDVQGKEAQPKNESRVIYQSNEIKTASQKIAVWLEKKAPKNIDMRKLIKFVKQSWQQKKYRYPLVAASLFLGIYLLFNLPLYYARWSWKKPEMQKTIVKTQEVVQKKSADSAALAPGEVIPAGNVLVIPKLNVNAPIVMADTTDENKVHDELHNGVVHYDGTAAPGEVGNSFITGHSSNYWWDTGKYNYVFVLLDKLQPGDQAIIYYNGKKFVYTMRDAVVVQPNDMSVLAPTDTPVLSLMTCTPAGTSLRRLVVHFDRTDPAYYKPTVVTKEKVVETPKTTTTTKGSSFWDALSGLLPN